jgi:tetratricopeptide (TPR) repeat protein
LVIREKALGPNHPDVAESLNNLAVLYKNQGRYTDAEPLYRRSLTIEEKALGPDHPAVATSLSNLASMYVDQGRYGDAEPLHRRSLAIREKTLGPNHRDVAASLSNLAELYRLQGRYADAEPFHRRSLVIREKALGPNHPDVWESLNNLAELYRVQGRYVDAEPLHKRSLAIAEKTLGPNHPHVAVSLNNLAVLYKNQGRFADALPLIRTAAQGGFDQELYLDVLTGALAKSLVLKTDAIDESYQVVQRATSSSASSAINQLSVRFAAGNDELAQLVRREQDLSGENDSLDKIMIAEVSKEPSKRVGAKEQQIRDRLKSIAAERAEIQLSLDHRFP